MVDVITVMDLNFNILGTIKDIKTLKVKRKWQNFNTLELTLPLTTKYMGLLNDDNILFYQKGYLVEGYIIVKKEFKKDSKGVESIVINALDILSILNWRIINTNMSFSNNYARTLINAVLNQNIINPTDSKRVVPNVVNLEGYSGDIIPLYDNSYGKCGNEIIKLAQEGNMGIKLLIDLENNKYKLMMIKSVDKSINANVNNHILFSREYNNLLDEKYTCDSSSFANMAYVLGEGEGSTRKKVEVNSTLSGFDRRELYVDARDLQQDTQTDAQYQTKLNQRGLTKLQETQRLKNFEGSINPKKYKYRDEWDLGDIVTIQDKKWGVTMDSCISEVEELYQNGTMKITPSVGSKIPNVIDKIKRAVN